LQKFLNYFHPIFQFFPFTAGLSAGKYSASGASSPTFQALFHYFADPVCSNATLTVLATGHYSPGSDSDRVQGATEFDFFVQSVIITVHDESTARNLNGLKVFHSIFCVIVTKEIFLT
jgi:hypothetical protein